MNMSQILFILVSLPFLVSFPPEIASATSDYPHYHLTNIKLYVSKQDSHSTPTHHILKMFSSVYRKDGLENGYALSESVVNDSGRTIPNIWIKVITSKNLTIEPTFEGPLDVSHPHIFNTDSMPMIDTGGGDFSDLYLFPLKPGPTSITVKFFENPQMPSTLMGEKTWRGTVVS